MFGERPLAKFLQSEDIMSQHTFQNAQLIDPARLRGGGLQFDPQTFQGQGFQGGGQQVGGLIGTLGSIFGGPLGGAAAGVLGAGINLLGGDGGQGRRIRTAETSISGLEGGQFNQNRFAMQRQQFLQSLQPFLQEQLRAGASRAGLGSGLVQSEVARQSAAPLAAFSTGAIGSQFAEIERNRRLATQLRTNLAIA